MSSQTTPASRTLRISARQLADAAYRALRVAGVPSGVAADAARDALELERAHARGLSVLDQILETGPPLLVSHCRSDAKGDLRARGASALMLAEPLVALAAERSPATLTIHALAHAGALEPALLRRARSRGLRFALFVSAGTPVLQVEPRRAVIGPGWISGWGVPLDARLVIDRAGGSAEAAAAVSPAGHITVDRQLWQRLAERALSYLVPG